mmetsp:Transcript_25181/g.63382  ORF Transcript_25181/g.63382 Transcript_25181/m.63382 type:complete len:216 (+) Transcript_25181:1604-2251(+)
MIFARRYWFGKRSSRRRTNRVLFSTRPISMCSADSRQACTRLKSTCVRYSSRASRSSGKPSQRRRAFRTAVRVLPTICVAPLSAVSALLDETAGIKPPSLFKRSEGAASLVPAAVWLPASSDIAPADQLADVRRPFSSCRQRTRTYLKKKNASSAREREYPLCVSSHTWTRKIFAATAGAKSCRIQAWGRGGMLLLVLLVLGVLPGSRAPPKLAP